MSEQRITFSVIIPTSGRSSLSQALASAAEQLEPGDEILVLCNRDGDFGNSARQKLMERAQGTHLVFMDDDDQFARGAFEAMRRFAAANPDRVGIFRIRYLDGRLLWTEPTLRKLNVSTQMYCVPNVAGKLGSWVDHSSAYSSDFSFIAETVELQGEPEFCSEVVANIRSDRRAAVRSVQRYVIRPVNALQRRVRAALSGRPRG